MEFKTQSGADVNICVSDFEAAMALKGAVSSELAKVGIDLSSIKLDKDTEVSEVLTPLTQAIFTLDSSKEVYEKLFVCLARCTYNREKITKQTFDDVKARVDFYEIMYACFKVNIFPFFEGPLSKLKTLGISFEKILK